MMRGRPGARRERLRTLFGAGTAAGSSDGQLLERFAGRRDTDTADSQRPVAPRARKQADAWV
jgi:hypothetical protein